jgi:hypothetical protein
VKVVICAIGIGGWYPRGIARMIERFHAVSSGFDIRAWVNCLPPGAPEDVVEDKYDYTAYCAKPFALFEASSDADVGILLDAAFYPVRHIEPLICHIAANGYYLCRNGYRAGEWASDRALRHMNTTREEAMEIEEASSYCVGLDFRLGQSRELLDQWCSYASDGCTFPGPHTNIHAHPFFEGRNTGIVSHDPRVRGHRHDQTALSIIAHRLGMTNLSERPAFTAYAPHSTAETVLENRGGL